jgi:predicted nucleic acid-binding protein
VRFVDTNVLLYAISTDEREQEKAAIADALLSCRDLVLSIQVLQEFYVQATRISRPDRISYVDAAGLVQAFRRFPVIATSTQILEAAINTHQRFDVSYWDAAILEAARTLGCEVVLSEDLSETVDYGGIRVENPFAGATRSAGGSGRGR